MLAVPGGQEKSFRIHLTASDPRWHTLFMSSMIQQQADSAIEYWTGYYGPDPYRPDSFEQFTWDRAHGRPDHTRQLLLFSDVPLVVDVIDSIAA